MAIVLDAFDNVFSSKLMKIPQLLPIASIIILFHGSNEMLGVFSQIGWDVFLSCLISEEGDYLLKAIGVKPQNQFSYKILVASTLE